MRILLCNYFYLWDISIQKRYRLLFSFQVMAKVRSELLHKEGLKSCLHFLFCRSVFCIFFSSGVCLWLRVNKKHLILFLSFFFLLTDLKQTKISYFKKYYLYVIYQLCYIHEGLFNYCLVIQRSLLTLVEECDFQFWAFTLA